MFKDDYKNGIDRIKPDGKIKEKILNKIDNNKSSKRKIVYRAIAAIAACAVILVSVAIYRDINKPVITPSISGETQTYNDVYKVIKNIKARSVINGVAGLFKGNIEYYEYAIEDEEMTIAESDAGDYSTTTDNTSTNAGGSKDHSETNTQVEGVAESDIVLTDGEYIYSLTQQGRGHLRIFSTGKEPELLSKTLIKSDLTYDSLYLVGSMYLYDNYLVIIGNHHATENFTVTLIYDISNDASWTIFLFDTQIQHFYFSFKLSLLSL